LASTEGTAQRTDLDLEIALLDEDLWPDPVNSSFETTRPAFSTGTARVSNARLPPPDGLIDVQVRDCAKRLLRENGEFKLPISPRRRHLEAP
jgi:hypothetical protein